MANVSNVAAQTTTSTPEINDIQFWSSKGDLSGENLKIDLGSCGGLKPEQGYRNLVSLTPLGQEPYGEYTKMKAKAVFTVDYNFYSLALSQTTYSGVSPKERSYLYAAVDLCTSPSTPSTYQPTAYYYQKFNDYDFSNAQLTPAAKGFDGRVSFNAQVIDLTPSNLDFGNTQFNVQCKSFVATVNRASIKASSSYQIAQYTDFWNDQMGKDAKLDVLDLKKSSATIDGGGIDTSSLNYLGLEVIGESYPNTGNLQQAGYKQTPSVNQDNIMEKGIPITIIPNIYHKVQQLKLTHQDKIVIDTVKNFWDVNTGILAAPQWSSPVQVNTDIYRTVGWHVDNYCVKVTIQVECDVYSLIEIIPKTSDKSIGSVDIDVSNATWTNTQGGDGATVTLTNGLINQIGENIAKWFEDNKIIIILVAIGIGLAAIAYVYYFTPFGWSLRNIQQTRRDE